MEEVTSMGDWTSEGARRDAELWDKARMWAVAWTDAKENRGDGEREEDERAAFGELAEAAEAWVMWLRGCDY